MASSEEPCLRLGPSASSVTAALISKHLPTAAALEGDCQRHVLCFSLHVDTEEMIPPDILQNIPPDAASDSSGLLVSSCTRREQERVCFHSTRDHVSTGFYKLQYDYNVCTCDAVTWT